MDAPLSGLRVLATRPAERVEPLLDAIRTAGGEAVSLPLLNIAPLDPERDSEARQALERTVRELDNYRHIVFISTNAVAYAMPVIRRHWPALPPHCRAHAIGRATAEAMQEAGLPLAATATAMDSESLLNEPELAAPAGEGVLIFRGVGGREHLANVLRERGARVDYAECYRREPAPVSATQLATVLHEARINCLVVASGETLETLARLASDTCRQLPLVVPSSRVARQAGEHGFTRVITAANAGTEATVSALQRCRQEQGA